MEDRYFRTTMPLLLDTHAFVWLAHGDERLSKHAIEAVSTPDEIVYVSVLTRWEIALKEGRRGFRFGQDFDVAMENSGFKPLDLGFEVPALLSSLPSIHADPFDRMLVAQALSIRGTLVTRDAMLHRYPVETLW